MTRSNSLKTFVKNLPFFFTVFIPVLIVTLKYNQSSNLSKKPKDWLFEMEQKYYKENERIKSICKNLDIKPKKIKSGWLTMYGPVWTDTRHKIVGCLNAKVGSSTWRYYLYNLLPEDIRRALEKRYGLLVKGI